MRIAINYHKFLRINILTAYPVVSQFNKLQIQHVNFNNSQYRPIHQISNWDKIFPYFNTPNIRNKYTKGSKNEEDSDSDDDVLDNFKDEKDSKVVRTRVNSLRADLILKAGLGIARNKVETIFYESKIRVNGKKLAKKSVQLEVGDEIDVIKGFSNVNTSHLIVARVVILSATAKEENLLVNLRRFKSLLVENYENINAFKSSE